MIKTRTELSIKPQNKGPQVLWVTIGIIGVFFFIYGRLADVANPQTAYIIVIPCYLYILFYAAIGHKIGKRVKIA